MASNESLEEAIRAEAERLGFAACGFARADAADGAGPDLRRWLEAGHHGNDGLDGNARRPARVTAGAVARSQIGDRARDELRAGVRSARAGARVPTSARISVYAQGGDYHKTVKKALKALARFIVDQAPSELKVFVDTAPVMEKPLAQAAGIGWQGKHTNLVSARAWQLAVPRRDPDQPRAGARSARRSRSSIAAPAPAASTPARRRRSTARTGSMRGAAFPT